jgi:nucleoside phosphorylase
MRISTPKDRMQTVSSNPQPLVDFVIITALDEERKAICREFNLTEADRVDTGPRRYWRGRLQLPNDEYYEIVVAQLPDMANIDASILTQDAIREWDPGSLLLVGIAAAANDEVELGDVVIASDIYYYERGKVTSAGKKPEPKVYKADPLLWNKVITNSEWNPRIAQPRPGRSRKKPAVHRGVIASGEKVIAEQAARDAIAKGNRKIIAIEMEGYGFSAAVFQSPHHCRHLVIKAISDRADQKKGDDWHRYAAAAAAAYTKHYLLDRPLGPRNSSKETPPDRVAEEVLIEHQHRRRIQQEGKHLLDQVLPELGIENRELGPNYSRHRGFHDPLVFPIRAEAQYYPDNPFKAIGSQVEGLMVALSEALSQEKLKRLEEIRKLYREGKVHLANQEIHALRQDESWPFLTSLVKIRILRLAAIFELNSEQPDMSEIYRIIDDIVRIDPHSEDLAFVKAYLDYREKGPDKTLEQLGNPTTVDIYNLRISLLIHRDRIEEALDELKNPPEGITQDTETKRLYALALLMAGHISQARNEIEEVLTERSEWDYARWARAIIYYYSGLSPAVRLRPFFPWPQPVDWFLINEGSRGVYYLRRAEEEFARLASETEHGEEHQKIIEAWRLACLANDHQRQKEASDYCQVLLNKDPANHMALAWAMTRGFRIETSICEAALERFLELSEGDFNIPKAEKTLALAGLYLERNNVLATVELLERTREGFIRIGNESIWTFWKAQALIANGTPEKALELSTKISDSSAQRSIRTMALRSIGSRSGNWGLLARHLEENFEETHSGIYLLELCKLKADTKEWKYVADHSAELIRLINTAEAFRLSIFACWFEKRVHQCLSIIEGYKKSLDEERLPSDLWRIQVYCQATFDLPLALANARDLAHLHPTTANLLLLIDIHHRMGDLKAVALIARELNTRNDVAPWDMLWIAKWICAEHRDLAIDFWRHAKERVLNDPDLLGYTITLGMTLGLDKETEPLFRKMEDYTAVGKGPFKVFTLDKLFEWKKERDEYLQFINQNYGKGTLPLHIIASEVGVTLAEILHRYPDENRRSFDPLSTRRIFIRHGGRASDSSLVESLSDRLLHLDISAILVAEDLGILEKVEKSFSPLYISSETPRSLSHQRLELMSQQPSRLNIFERVLDLLENRKLDQFSHDVKPSDDLTKLVKEMGERWVAILSTARLEGALIVDYLPLKSHDQKRVPIKLPKQFQTSITNCRAIVESLKNNGGLSIPSYEKALKELGSEKEPYKLAVLPAMGTKLFLVSNIIEFLVNADVMDLACEKFQIFVDPLYVNEARQTISSNVRQAEVASWLERLTNRINSGLTAGVYKAVNRSEVLKEVTEHEDRLNLDFMAATELLRYKFSEKDVLWFDDRYFNSYSSRDRVVPIIGINEILEALRLRDELSVKDQYDLLLKLRQSNYRYIPIAKGEIFYHLHQAQLNSEGRIIETHELSVLRRYFASCFLDAESLQTPPVPEGFPNLSGEITFITQTTHAVTDAFIELWADENSDIQTTIARSEWILNNLYTGLFGLIHLLPNPEMREDAINEIGMDIGSLLGAGIAIGTRNLRSPMLSDTMRNRRKEYFKWLDKRLVSRRFRADPISLDAVVPLNCTP